MASLAPPLLVTPSLRSPRAQAKNNARLLRFHHNYKETGLPPTSLQEEIRRGVEVNILTLAEASQT